MSECVHKRSETALAFVMSRFCYFWGYNLNKSVKFNNQMGKMKHKT